MSTHFQGLGKAWSTLFESPEKQVPDVIALTMTQGKTRECWKVSTPEDETMVLGWPSEATFRVGTTVRGQAGDAIRPVSSYPLLEGLPNDLTVQDTYFWMNGTEGSVSACRNEDANPIWFYSPFLFRDREMLTPGVRHTFLLSGLAYGIRRALLDEMTITEGPNYEQFVKQWLEQNPEATRADVPQLKIPLAGSRILMPDEVYGEYQARVPVTSVEETNLGGEKIYMMIVEFGLNTPCPLQFPLYATERICKKYVPKRGDEIDAFIWLQGRLAD